jgi:FixJ family two-component response regulator
MSNSQEIVAIIDDEPEMRAAMRRLVSAYGYDAHTFDSAETFLARASTFRASCLLVDIELGDLSGIELARQLAADGFKFPIIFMTGHDDATIESQAMAAGGIALLRKPFPAEMLIDAIKRAVAANYSPRLISRMPKS